MNLMTIENVTKTFGEKKIFDNITFGIDFGDKVGLIGINGAGKSTLLKLVAGEDTPDSGQIIKMNGLRIGYLPQTPDFDPEDTVLGQVFNCDSPVMSLIKQYEQAVRDVENGGGEAAEKALFELNDKMDAAEAWNLESDAKTILTKLNITDFNKKAGALSGGQIKRMALARALITPVDLLILDEPTNHIDNESIDWLEKYLEKYKGALLMVTHDRYFLDRVCNIVMEMDRGAVYTYKGNYQNYLEKREERIANYNAETDKVRNILRRELEWIRSTPCARTGKARYRINAFYDLKDRASQAYTTQQVNMADIKGASRLGTKIINCKDLSFYYGEDCYLDKFTYNFQRYEKVGIVGRNGAGKSTFLNIITGNFTADMVSEDPRNVREGQGLMTGVIERGESLKIGYYHQSGMSFTPQDTVLDIVNDTWLLNRFLFPHEMLNNKIEKLSGGEKRRLYLLTILMQQPNLLILDEPTNDLDIVTLNILEEYLKEFGGSLIIVSHDRHFLDKLVDHLFIFCGNGLVKDFVGSYSEYREFIKEYEAEQRSQARAKEKSEKEQAAKEAAKTAPEAPAKKKKLTYKEQREMEQLEKDLEDLATEKAELEAKLNSGTLPFDQLQAASERIGRILEETDEKELRLLELYENM